MRNRLFIVFQYVVPHHLLSRLIGLFAASELVWFKNFLIRMFIKKYGVNMQEACITNPEGYSSFNDFFTRELALDARPLDLQPSSILCPADGAISAIGEINQQLIFQAKGKEFSLKALLGGDDSLSNKFENGSFATIYLSPKDYHRVHMPVSGRLSEMIFVPGKLFSVNQTTAENIDGLFAKNERVVSIFNTENGPVAVILVGAMIVASIETVWAGIVAPAGNSIQSTTYAENDSITLDKGAEMGRFKLGSTAIILFGKNTISWIDSLNTGDQVCMGQPLGHLKP